MNDLFDNDLVLVSNKQFYELLNKKMENNEKEDEENICLISNTELTKHSIKLQCGHKFNYLPLLNEFYNQKYVNRYYTIDNLNHKEFLLYRKSKKNYYLKCPYCRVVQFNIIPYVESIDRLKIPKYYGINTEDITFAFHKSNKENNNFENINIQIIENIQNTSTTSNTNTNTQNISTTSNTNTNKQNISNIQLCEKMLKKGKNKGLVCNKKLYKNNSCYYHFHYSKMS